MRKSRISVETDAPNRSRTDGLTLRRQKPHIQDRPFRLKWAFLLVLRAFVQSKIRIFVCIIHSVFLIAGSLLADLLALFAGGFCIAYSVSND
jgi:hypothetical protein